MRRDQGMSRDSSESSLCRNRDDFMLPQQHAGERGRAPCEAPCLGSKRWAESPPLAVVQPFQRVPGCAIHCWQHSFLRCGPTERCAVHNCTTRWNSMRRAAMHRECRGCGQAGPTPSIRRCLCPEPERGQPRQPRAAVGRHHAAPANGSSQSYNGGFTAPNLCFGACSLGQNTDTKILFEIRE